MKIPDPAELNPIEIAVWAAEFVRVRNTPAIHRVPRAIDAANYAIADLRRAKPEDFPTPLDLKKAVALAHEWAWLPDPIDGAPPDIHILSRAVLVLLGRLGESDA